MYRGISGNLAKSLFLLSISPSKELSHILNMYYLKTIEMKWFMNNNHRHCHPSVATPWLSLWRGMKARHVALNTSIFSNSGGGRAVHGNPSCLQQAGMLGCQQVGLLPRDRANNLHQVSENSAERKADSLYMILSPSSSISSSLPNTLLWSSCWVPTAHWMSVGQSWGTHTRAQQNKSRASIYRSSSSCWQFL